MLPFNICWMVLVHKCQKERVDRMRDRLHDEAMSEQFDSDPAYVADLLADVLRDGSPAELDILLRQLNRTKTTLQQAKGD